ncbi:MAG: hypothetical protein IJX83_03815 [Lachnospiraceae bacterium]|nr:hypothetical protein [Lachnospiraceae bacterium]
MSKYTSLEEEQDNLVTRIFAPALEKVGTEAYKSKICVHEKQDSSEYDEKTGVQRNFWRVSEISGDENTENKGFCAET